jgi:hypothetical protein
LLGGAYGKHSNGVAPDGGIDIGPAGPGEIRPPGQGRIPRRQKRCPGEFAAFMSNFFRGTILCIGDAFRFDNVVGDRNR